MAAMRLYLSGDILQAGLPENPCNIAPVRAKVKAFFLDFPKPFG
jgi:hypothetical protein